MAQPALIPPVPSRLPERVRCRRCGRALHDPVSRMLRLGRECRALHDPVSRMLRLGRECRGPQDPVRVVAGEQETLPGLAAPTATEGAAP
ncbi:DUF6011 domain-containing protein [Kitasatospora sp. KL5]|uniref:DUF6011 domain-containing protein n=1 Tax=Kitasatospora sp. KL5 TaxID=3425125 RepID=UPI003D6E1DC9